MPRMKIHVPTDSINTHKHNVFTFVHAYLTLVTVRASAATHPTQPTALMKRWSNSVSYVQLYLQWMWRLKGDPPKYTHLNTAHSKDTTTFVPLMVSCPHHMHIEQFNTSSKVHLSLTHTHAHINIHSLKKLSVVTDKWNLRCPWAASGTLSRMSRQAS